MSKKINEYKKIAPEEVVDDSNVKYWALYATSFYEKLLSKIKNPEVVKSVYRNLMMSGNFTIEDKKALTFFYRLRRSEMEDSKFWNKIQNKEGVIHENYKRIMKAKLIKESINEKKLE